jgi:hypothetical protein
MKARAGDVRHCFANIAKARELLGFELRLYLEECMGEMADWIFHTDYSVPVERVRQKLAEIVKEEPLWDGQVVHPHVTDAREGRLELRATVSARTLEDEWEICCAVRCSTVEVRA